MILPPLVFSAQSIQGAVKCLSCVVSYSGSPTNNIETVGKGLSGTNALAFYFIMTTKQIKIIKLLLGVADHGNFVLYLYRDSLYG